MTACGSLHVPARAVSVAPTVASPAIAGAERFVGAPEVTAVVIEEDALSMPVALVAVTVTRKPLPRSPTRMRYVLASGAPIEKHWSPVQRSHEYANVADSSVHSPLEAVRTPPVTALPVTVGKTRFNGEPTCTASVGFWK